MRSKTINGLVSDFMCANPLLGSSTMDEPELKLLLSKVLSATPFLPIVNELGLVEKILLDAPKDTTTVNALIMAGGYGTRLGAKTSNTPKALVKVRGTPLIEHVFRRLDLVKFDKIFVSVHFLADQVEDYLKKIGRDKQTIILRESKPLGTAGALGLLPTNLTGQLLVTNCDIISNFDPNALFDFHNSSKSDALIAVASHDFSVPYGVVKSDMNGLYSCIIEKPIISNFVAAGIYSLSQNFYKNVRPNERIDMPDLLNKEAVAGKKISIFPLHENWSDVGTIEELVSAENKDC